MVKRISFWAKKRVPIKKRVSFRTGSGKKISFLAKKEVSKPIKIIFYARE